MPSARSVTVTDMVAELNVAEPNWGVTSELSVALICSIMSVLTPILVDWRLPAESN